MKILLVLVFLIIVIVLFVANDQVIAQCPMCKISTESNLSNGGTAGRGMNTGIFYLLFAPYLLVGGLAYYWWRNKNSKQ